MKNFKLLAGIALCATVAFTSCNGIGGTDKMSNAQDSAAYLYGAFIGTNLSHQQINANLDINRLARGVYDGFIGKEGLPTAEEIATFLDAYYMKASVEESQKNLEEGRAFLEKNKNEEGVITTESGLQYKVLVAADGAKPTLEDTVKVNYHGTLIDGTVFDSSVDRGEPAVFPLSSIIPGWQEVIPMMSVGSKWKVWIPTELGYGEYGAGSVIGPNVPLVFEIELLDINPSAEE